MLGVPEGLLEGYPDGFDIVGMVDGSRDGAFEGETYGALLGYSVQAFGQEASQTCDNPSLHGSPGPSIIPMITSQVPSSLSPFNMTG